jgi:prepilin peptidase CpaA
MAEPYQHAVFLVAIAVAAVSAALDWRTGLIPSWLTLPAAIAAPLIHLARFRLAGEPSDDAATNAGLALAGAALCAIVPLVLFRQGAIGGGDVKLFVAIGALLQPRLGVEAQMYGFFAGAVLAPAKLAYEGKLFTTIKNAFAIGANLFLPKSRQRSIDAAALSWFRLGPAVLLGVALTAYLNW